MKKTKKIIVTSLAAISLLSLTACSGEIQNSVVDGYQKVEDFFVDGYKTVENFFVDGYKTVEDKCIEWFFAKDGESVEDARDRLNGMNPNGDKTNG